MVISEASGDDADGLARPAPEAEQHAPGLVARLTDGDEARVEGEKSTGATKAGVTAQHVIQAATKGAGLSSCRVPATRRTSRTRSGKTPRVLSVGPRHRRRDAVLHDAPRRPD